MIIYSLTSGTVSPKGTYEGPRLYQHLSEQGFRQAEGLAGRFASIKELDILVTSPATRAIQTSQIMSRCANPLIVPTLWPLHHAVFKQLKRELGDKVTLDAFLNHPRGNEVHAAGRKIAGEINELNPVRLGFEVAIFSHPIIAQLVGLKLAEMVDGSRAHKALEACRSSILGTGEGFVLDIYNDTYTPWKLGSLH